MLHAALFVLSTAIPPPPDPHVQPDAFVPQRRRYERTQWAGASALGSWAVANLATGIAGAVLIADDRRFFHQMNAMWNTVNLALALTSIVRLARPKKVARTPTELSRASQRTQRIYLVNGALDVVYVAVGAITAAVGTQVGNPRARGYGSSIAVQGLFLFAFDLAMVIATERALAPRARPSRPGLP